MLWHTSTLSNIRSRSTSGKRSHMCSKWQPKTSLKLTQQQLHIALVCVSTRSKHLFPCEPMAL